MRPTGKSSFTRTHHHNFADGPNDFAARPPSLPCAAEVVFPDIEIPVVKVYRFPGQPARNDRGIVEVLEPIASTAQCG